MMNSLIAIKFSNKKDLAIRFKLIAWSIENNCHKSGYLNKEQQDQLLVDFEYLKRGEPFMILEYRKSIELYNLLLEDATPQITVDNLNIKE